MSAPKLLIADRGHDEWLHSLEAALGLDPHALTITSDGNVVKEALSASPCPYKLIILGDQLANVSGLDAMYLAAEQRKAHKTQEHGGRIVALITDVRDDVEMLALLRKKGIEGFVYRDTPVDETARRFRDWLFAASRVEPRVPVHVKVTVVFREAEIAGVMEDLSISGARIVVPTKKVPHLPQAGEAVTLQAEVEFVQLRCPAVIRRIELRKALLSDRMVIGVSFGELDFDTRKALETAFERARRAGDPLPVEGSTFGTP